MISALREERNNSDIARLRRFLQRHIQAHPSHEAVLSIPLGMTRR